MSKPSLIYPLPFSKGETIGIAAPASPPEKPDIIDEAIARLTAQGFKVRPSKHLRKREGYLAGTDEERAGDINALFADPEVMARAGFCHCSTTLQSGRIRNRLSATATSPLCIWPSW
jgi:hypothetical protein